MPPADSTPPFFFRRDYRARDERAKAGEFADTGHVLFLGPDDGLVIYGRKVVSPYPEDQEALLDAERRGWIFTESFSVACVEGELGSQWAKDCVEITREEFEAARARGWAS